MVFPKLPFKEKEIKILNFLISVFLYTYTVKRLKVVLISFILINFILSICYVSMPNLVLALVLTIVLLFIHIQFR